jgi:Uma2 family endonuclease
MATEIQAPPRTETGLKLYRLSVRQFEKMIDAGVLDQGPRVELVGGVLLERMTKNQPHNYAVGQLADGLRSLVPAGWFVDEEKPSEIDRWSRPEPDIAIIRGKRADFRQRSPQAKDHGLVIEVADTTYTKDKGTMWRRYAAARIPCYWIVNLAAKRIEVYTDPAGKGRSAGFRKVQNYGGDEHVPVILEDRELGRIAVRDVMP